MRAFRHTTHCSNRAALGVHDRPSPHESIIAIEEGAIYELVTPVYGLNTAPVAWYQSLRRFMAKHK